MLTVYLLSSSGLTVITTCSPRNFDLVKSYGADKVFDYSDSTECGKQIREYTNDNLKHAFDCISEKTSPQICADALSSAGGIYSALLKVENFPRKDVEHSEHPLEAHFCLGSFGSVVCTTRIAD